MSTADIHSLAGAYTLHAISPAEREQFDLHLAECASCSIEIAELQETAARLADDSPVTPPPGLRASVMAEIRQTHQRTPGPQPYRARRTPRLHHRGMQLVAAALLVIVAVGGTFLVLDEDHSNHSSPIEVVMSAPDAKVRTQTVRNGGTLTTITSADRGETVVMLSEAAPVGGDKAYQLWLIKDNGKPVDAGVLAAGATKDTRVLMVHGADTVALSVEPVGGSPTPTTVVASVKIL